MKKIIALFITITLVLSLGSVIAYADGGTAETDVYVEVDNPDGYPPFLIYDEETLRLALTNADYSVLPIQNDITIVTGTPLITTPNRTAKLISATGEPLTITQTGTGQRHFSFTNLGTVDMDFDNIILDGGDVGGGFTIKGNYNQYKIRNAIIQNCRNGWGGAIEIITGEYHMYGGKIINNFATGHGGAVYSSNGFAEFYLHDDGEISGNGTNGDGGAICNITGKYVLNGGIISGNTANGNGGGIYSGHGLVINGTEVSDNISNTGNGGGIALADLGGLEFTNCYIHNNTAQIHGGGIYLISNGTGGFNIDGGTISNNTAVTGNGGGISYLSDYWDDFIITGSLTFSGNTSAKAYWIEKDDDFVYSGKPASYYKTLYDTTIKSHIVSLSDPPNDTASFSYMYNGYDVSYLGSIFATISPGDEELKFDSSMVVGDLIYAGTVDSTDQLFALKSGPKPEYKIYNNSQDLWKLRVKYVSFTVNGMNEPDILLALRGSDGEYTTLAKNLTHTIYTATAPHTADFVTTIPWGTGDDDLLKVFIPQNRYDLANKEIKAVIEFTLEPVIV